MARDPHGPVALPALTPRRRGAARTLLLAVAAVMLPLAAALGSLEVALRLFNRFGPAPPAVLTIRPGGRYQEPDSQLGFRPLAGRFEVVFGNGDRWTLTNRQDRTRATRAEDRTAEMPGTPGIWVFGCSFMQGWGLNDEETAAWRLQEAMPSFAVSNFGVGGYGTLQSLLQYRRALAERPAPAAVLLAYADFHDQRNTRSNAWRDANVPYSQFGTTAQPFARLDGEALVFGFDDGSFPFLWLRRRVRLVEGMARGWGRLQDGSLRSADVSRRLLAEFLADSRRHGVTFVLLGVGYSDATRAMLREFSARGVPTADMAVDPRVAANTIRFDSHPNATANAHFAAVMLDTLRGAGIIDAAGIR